MWIGCGYRHTCAQRSRFYRHFLIKVLYVYCSFFKQTCLQSDFEYIYIKRVLERRTTAATLDKYTAKRPDKIKTRHVKIIRYLQSWNAMSIDFEQRISHNAFRLLYARQSKSYSHPHIHTHTGNQGPEYCWKINFFSSFGVFSLTDLIQMCVECLFQWFWVSWVGWLTCDFQYWFTPCVQRRSNQLHLSNLWFFLHFKSQIAISLSMWCLSCIIWWSFKQLISLSSELILTHSHHIQTFFFGHRWFDLVWFQQQQS